MHPRIRRNRLSGLARPAALAVALITALTAALMAGCATHKDVEKLEQQTQMTRDETREMFNLLEAEIRKSSDPVREKQADLWAEVEVLSDEVADLKGQVAELTMRLNYLSGDNNATAPLPELSAEVKAISLALEQQLAIDLDEVRKQVAATRPDPLAVTTPPVGTAVVPVADPAQALYDKAYSTFGEGGYEAAVAMFGEFIEAYPDHSLVANAMFWQGQAYFEIGDFEKAILSYQEVVSKFPSSAKHKHSLLKQGIAFYRLGKKDVGAIVLGELVEKYPDSAEATRAKQYMSEH